MSGRQGKLATMDPQKPLPVEYVSPDAPHDPPRPLNLPFGAVCAAVTTDRTRWPEVASWLVANGLHDNQFVAVGGVHIYRVTKPGAHEYDWYVVVDYQAGGVHDPSTGDDWVDAKRGLLLNHEAGRCHRTHPRAQECAIDRHARLVTVEPGEELRGAFETSWTGTVYPPRTPWLDLLLDRPAPRPVTE